MSEREILRRAKEELILRGLCKGVYCADPFGNQGSVCMAGAVNVAETGDARRGVAPMTAGLGLWKRAQELLADHLPEGSKGSVPYFNDLSTTHLADAVAVFDRALGSLPAEAPELEKEPVHA